MLNYFIELLSKKSLKVITFFMVSGKELTFRTETSKFGLSKNNELILIDVMKKQYAINPKQIENIIISE